MNNNKQTDSVDQLAVAALNRVDQLETEIERLREVERGAKQQIEDMEGELELFDAENERLRSTIEAISNINPSHTRRAMTNRLIERVSELEVENERLQRALQAFLDDWHDKKGLEEALKEARSALEGRK